MIRDQLITTFRGQNLSRDNDRASTEKTDAPADSAKYPRLIKMPPNKEPVFIIEQVCLEAESVRLSPLLEYVAVAAAGEKPTTIDILAA